MTAGMAAVLLSVTLFSCSSDVPYEHTDYSTTDNICFGISDSGNGTRAAAANEAITTDRYVLRSSESSDTLCVRAVVSDGRGKAAAKHATRASMQTTMYDQFSVVAQLKNSDGNIAPRYYMNEVATKQGVVWQPSSSIYYWPDNGSLRFLAWAPLDAELDESPVKPSEDVNKTTIKYTVPVDLSKQRDLVAAATGYNASPAGGVCAPVSLQFKHLCTAVVIKTGATMAPGTIKSVTIKNVRNSGTYDMLSSAWTLTDATANYTVSPDMATSSTTAEGTKLNADDATFMLLPQTLGADSKLEVLFHDNISGRDRLLTASLNGAEWPMGKTVTYRLSITPEYELEFTSEPQVQDAHYVIYPITIKADNLGANGWKLVSNDTRNVTFVENFGNDDIKRLVDNGYWLKDYCGKSELTSTTRGDIKVYVFIKENITDADRDIKLTLTPADYPNAAPVTFDFKQYCPAWNNGIGVERKQETDYPWGFNWDSSMKITYSMPKGFWMGIWHALFTIFGNTKYVTQEGYAWTGTWKVTVDFSKVPKLTTATSATDGLKNTWEIYNFEGISDAETIMRQLESWGGVPDKTLPTNPTEFAAAACAKKNPFGVSVESKDGQNLYVPTLSRSDMVWYLPAQDEASNMLDELYPLSGNYWTSTAITDPGTTSYKYTVGASASPEDRNNFIHVRAVRKRP